MSLTYAEMLSWQAGAQAQLDSAVAISATVAARPLAANAYDRRLHAAYGGHLRHRVIELTALLRQVATATEAARTSQPHPLRELKLSVWSDRMSVPKRPTRPSSV